MILFNKQIYQIGNGNSDYFIFNKEDLNIKFPRGVKTNIDKNSLGDGESDANGTNRDFKEDYIIELDYIIKSGDDVNVLDKILFGGTFPIFFYEKLYDDAIRFWVQYGKCVSQPTRGALANEQYGLEYEGFSVKIRLINPYLLSGFDTDLKYIDIDTYNDNIYRYDGTYNYDGTITYNAFEAGYKTLSTLTPDEQLETFVNCEQPNMRARVPLLLADKYIALDEVGIDTTNSFTHTFASNNVETVDTDDMVLTDSNTDIDIYLIKISPLAKDEWVTIANQGNDSGLKITWLHNNANTNDIIYNSYRKKFYDSVTGEEIESINGKIQIDYDTTTRPRFLYFSGLESNSINKSRIQTLNLQTNAGTPADIDITIKNLNIKH